ncbi:MAG: hypothetical protein HYX47_01805 [Burkholderiales bacterium]|nr:hypothetical protein [Burkholderiales bacterium]
MPEEWDRARYEREKRGFIESRLRTRSVNFHAALIFAVTWLAGWLVSWALLKLGMISMPLRYAISFSFSYVVFVACVRIWSDFMREPHGSGGWDGSLDFPAGVDGEGCAVFLIALLAGLLLAGVFAVLGGAPLLLEVAFEVVFAGVVVRRLSRKETVGAWAERLIRNTWRPAALALVALVGLAAWMQAQAPGSRTFAQAARALLMP